MRDALESALTGRRAVVVELTLTDFIDSSILGVLLAGLRRAREASLGFVFVVQGDDGRAVNRTLAGSGLLAFFPIRGSLPEATDAARAGADSARPGLLR